MADVAVLIIVMDPPSLIIHVRDNLYDSIKLRVAIAIVALALFTIFLNVLPL